MDISQLVKAELSRESMAFIKQHQIAGGNPSTTPAWGVKPTYRDTLGTIDKTKPRRAAEIRGRALLPSIAFRARLGSVLADASQRLPLLGAGAV